MVASSPFRPGDPAQHFLLLGIILSERDAASYCPTNFFEPGSRVRAQTVQGIAFAVIDYGRDPDAVAGRPGDIWVAVAGC
jgi:hypothetical protein